MNCSQPCDGLGRTVKRIVTRAVLNHSAIVHTADQFYDYCVQNLTEVGRSSYVSRRNKYTHSRRSFQYIPAAEVKAHHASLDLLDVKTVKGTRKIHSITSMDLPFLMKTRDLSCVCAGCLSGRARSKKKAVLPWKTVGLKQCSLPAGSP